MTMTINVEMVKMITVQLLNKERSREQVAEWAFDLMKADDNNELEYEPMQDEELLWDSIDFLQGVDLKDTPNSYLHNEEDIQGFLQKISDYK